jgi:DNA repair protein RecO (recombination protein O)
MNNELESAKGWLIHHYPIRDRLYLLYILTPRKLLKAFYRLPKTQTVKPQLFYPYWVCWQDRKGNCNIKSLELTKLPVNLQGMQLFTGLYLNELIFHLCRQGEMVPNFFELYEQLIAKESCDEHLLRQFEWQLLADCGYAIDFTTTTDYQPIQADAYYQFLVDQGFVLQASGILGRHLLAIAQGEWQETETYLILKKILRLMIDQVLGGKILHSRLLLKEWLQQAHQ